MKRNAASESDNEAFYDEEGDLTKVGSPSQSCYRSDRKRRRGVIEKRRRDRINNSLTELRRLVPSAFEKQDSAKLEKAEILQMTVDHLKSLHAKGVSGYNLDTAVLAMDYRTVGFRECAAEVARYLISVEGMDIQDPMRLRLMNHLQCYCAQRDAAARASIQNSTWSHHPPHHHHHLAASNSGQPVHYGGGGGGGASGNVAQQHPSSQVEQSSTAAASSLSVYVDAGRGTPRNHQNHHHHHHASLGGDGSSRGGGVVVGAIPAMRLPPSVVTVAPQMSSSAGSTAAAAAVTPMGGPMMISGLPSVHSQFLGVNSVAMLSPNGFHYGPSHQNVKPYRPWGSELVY